MRDLLIFEPRPTICVSKVNRNLVHIGHFLRDFVHSRPVTLHLIEPCRLRLKARTIPFEPLTIGERTRYDSRLLARVTESVRLLINERCVFHVFCDATRRHRPGNTVNPVFGELPPRSFPIFDSPNGYLRSHIIQFSRTYLNVIA